MNSQQNKKLLQDAFTELAIGNSQRFVEAMHEDFSWTISGTGSWARTWHGKASVRGDLFRPLFAQFATTYRNTASRFVAEADIVVVQCKGNVETKSGERYDNDYCYICRFADDGKLIALTEYMDTALAERVLSPPPAVAT